MKGVKKGSARSANLKTVMSKTENISPQKWKTPCKLRGVNTTRHAKHDMTSK